MAEPATLVESCPVVTANPTVIAGDVQDGTKSQASNKNGKKSDGSSSSGTFFTWFIVLALLGVWTSIAVVYFDLVDYQGVLGKLAAYDTDGDGDFDVEDAKTLLDEKPRDAARGGAKNETSPAARDAGWKLREALKQQLALIHERVEAKKLAKMALAEVRQLLVKEEEEKQLELGRKEMSTRVKERVAARLKEEEDRMAEEETEKALEKLRGGKREESKNEGNVDGGKEVESEGKKGDETKGNEPGKGKGKKSKRVKV